MSNFSTPQLRMSTHTLWGKQHTQTTDYIHLRLNLFGIISSMQEKTLVQVNPFHKGFKRQEGVITKSRINPSPNSSIGFYLHQYKDSEYVLAPGLFTEPNETDSFHCCSFKHDVWNVGILESITVVCLSCTGVIAVVLSYLYISLHTTGVRHTKKTERKT